MFKDRNNSSDDGGYGGESSNSKLPHHVSDDKVVFLEKDSDFCRDSEVDHDGSRSKPLKVGNPGSQELTLSYLCDNSKLGLSDKDVNPNNPLNPSTYKGKVVLSEDHDQGENRWVERDFLQLNEMRGNCFKREAEDQDFDRDNKDKKPKIETLNLSLALPDVSLSFAASTRVPNGDPSVSLKPNRTLQQPIAPSNSNTQNTYSNDFTAASLSYSYSHQFSHNPSCSLTRNSTEIYENSVGSHRRDCDQIWNGGEGTNGSVHSRFRPLGDGVALSNHGRGVLSLMQGSNRATTNSDNLSLFPSELPARPKMENLSGDSRGKGSENVRGFEGLDGERARKLSRPERILREIVTESIPTMAQIFQELPEETIESTKEYLKNLITTPEKRDELVGLQARLDRRLDLTKEALLKANKNQLEILVAIKMGLGSFLSNWNRLPFGELVEIFLFERCKNVNCKRLLPVEDCDCKICSTKKGFCSECMCPVCLNFDCATNTCSWVGCDVCSHWCHATCSIQKNLIKPGPSLKGPSGTTEMLFHCLGCGHASEMFGFIKDVFKNCAKQWSLETLMKELDSVRKIFRGSEDFKGKELHMKASDMLSKLESKVMSSADVCNFIFRFFDHADDMSDFPVSNFPSKDMSGIPQDHALPVLPPSKSLPPSSSLYNRDGKGDNELKAPLMRNELIEDEWSVKSSKKDRFDSMESLVRIKEAEARMFQNRADEARREAEGYRRMVRIKMEKLDEEYTDKIAKLCLQEIEERRRKKVEELKQSENSHCDYYKMKMRMQEEIAGLLERMEKTKQQWV